MSKYILPVILIALQFGAGVMCAVNKDIKMCVYWLAAAVLNISVTF